MDRQSRKGKKIIMAVNKIKGGGKSVGEGIVGGPFPCPTLARGAITASSAIEPIFCFWYTEGPGGTSSRLRWTVVFGGRDVGESGCFGGVVGAGSLTDGSLQFAP